MVQRNIDQAIICIPKGIILEEIFRKSYVHSTTMAEDINRYNFEKITYLVLTFTYPTLELNIASVEDTERLSKIMAPSII